jgi:hypothetical protein
VSRSFPFEKATTSNATAPAESREITKRSSPRSGCTGSVPYANPNRSGSSDSHDAARREDVQRAHCRDDEDRRSLADRRVFRQHPHSCATMRCPRLQALPGARPRLVADPERDTLLYVMETVRERVRERRSDLVVGQRRLLLLHKDAIQLRTMGHSQTEHGTIVA